MTTWIEERLTSEINRRNAVGRVQSAAPKIIEAVNEYLKSYVEEFQNKFPDSKDQVDHQASSYSIVMTRRLANNTTVTASLRIEPIRACVSVEVTPSKIKRSEHPIKFTLLEESGLGKRSMESIAQEMAKPVLFPGLTDDAHILRLLSDEFR